jgi:hypothetical protein
LKEWFLDVGFSMKIELPVYVLEEVVFCQSQPVYDGHEYIMVRDPRTAIAKDSVSLKPLDNDSISRKWFAAVGIGGVSITGGIPNSQEYYTTIARASQGAKPLEDPTLETGLAMLSRGMDRHYTEVQPETRLSFWLAFGISPAEQVAAEGVYKDLQLLPSPMAERPVRGYQLYF